MSARAARAQPECPGSARRPLGRMWLSTLISAQPAPALAGRQGRHANAAVAPRCHLQQHKSQQTSSEVCTSKCKSMPKTRSGCLRAAQHSGVLALPGTELSSAADHRHCLDGTRALLTGLSGYGWDPKNTRQDTCSSTQDGCDPGCAALRQQPGLRALHLQFCNKIGTEQEEQQPAQSLDQARPPIIGIQTANEGCIP